MNAHNGPEWNAVEDIFHKAMSCDICFHQGAAEKSRVDIAQPRWIGPNYFEQKKKIMLVTMIPGSGKGEDTDRKNIEFRDVLSKYRDNRIPLHKYFMHQRGYIPFWGSRPKGRYSKFYVDGFGLDLDKVAIGCIAWCAEKNDKRIPEMFSQCFNSHTSKLIGVLSPDIVILSGGEAKKYSRDISRIKMGMRIINTLSYAHRESREREKEEFDRVRRALSM